MGNMAPEALFMGECVTELVLLIYKFLARQPNISFFHFAVSPQYPNLLAAVPDFI